MKTIALLALLAAGTPAPQERAPLLADDLHTEILEYKQGDVVLEGYLACPKDAKGKLPGVLICHQWMGHSDYERRRAEQTARLGTVAFALDPKEKDFEVKGAGDGQISWRVGWMTGPATPAKDGKFSVVLPALSGWTFEVVSGNNVLSRHRSDGASWRQIK